MWVWGTLVGDRELELGRDMLTYLRVGVGEGVGIQHPGTVRGGCGGHWLG